jgi:hypothetical protein
VVPSWPALLRSRWLLALLYAAAVVALAAGLEPFVSLTVRFASAADTVSDNYAGFTLMSVPGGWPIQLGVVMVSGNWMAGPADGLPGMVLLLGAMLEVARAAPRPGVGVRWRPSALVGVAVSVAFFAEGAVAVAARYVGDREITIANGGVYSPLWDINALHYGQVALFGAVLAWVFWRISGVREPGGVHQIVSAPWHAVEEFQSGGVNVAAVTDAASVTGGNELNANHSFRGRRRR